MYCTFYAINICYVMLLNNLLFSYIISNVTRDIYKMWGSGAGDYFWSVLINDGLADFRDIH